MLLVITILVIASVLASGILFRHQRIFTFIAAAGALWDGQWMLLTLIDRTWLKDVDTQLVFTVGALMFLALWLIKKKDWSWPDTRSGSGRRDLMVLPILLAVLGAAWLVQSKNGFENSEWVTHGFYNGDTMTMVSLVQKSLLTEGMVTENPFAGNGYLEYPTLWHAGLATLIKGLNLGMDWIHYLNILTWLQIILVVPMFFLVMDVFWPEPKKREEKWLGVDSRLFVLGGQALLIGYVMAVSWDNYIYPQTHFFLTGIFLLVVSLLIKASKVRGRKECWYLTVSGLMALVLMLSNAVTGAVVVAITVVYYGWRLLDSKQEIDKKLLWLGGIVAWLIIYALLSTGDAVLGMPGFSYTSAESIMRFSPIVIMLAAALLLRGNRDWLDMSIVVMFAMTAVIFFFSQRNIVVANAERFIYHGLLIGFPLLLAPGIRFYYWIRGKITVETNGFVDKTVALGAMAGILSILVMPVLISGARAHDSLMRQDKQVVDLGYREALEFVRNNTDADDVFLADPEAPWALPMFTGRAMLRASYWLSPKDSVFDDVNTAYEGEEAAQISSLQRVDYLIIKQEELNNWKLDEYKEVFRGGKISIFKTKG